jgi:hypothetical protein
MTRAFLFANATAAALLFRLPIKPLIWLRFVLGKADDRSRSMDQQCAQVSIATLADPQQCLLAAAGPLLWHQTKP